MSTVLHNIPKGEAYTLKLKFPEIASGSIPSTAAINGAPTSKLIYKDGGSQGTLINSPVGIDVGFGSITLTADEMNADLIEIYLYRANVYSVSAIIYTDGYNPSTGGGATAQEVWEYATRTITSSPEDALDVGDIQSLQAFIKKYAAGFTEKQLLALLVKQLKNS